MSHWVDLIQWPAFAASVVAAWLVGSENERRRKWGFWVFLASNVLWVCWGLPAGANAVIALQVCLAVMNVRGLVKAAKRN
ncbi:MAG: YgjV family protein [Gammaproteobacteria bacterium]|nr:YgjV family protein [Gammaproteobacteria bacterium]MBU0830716.1 YgjV family protein [Gammaproteobacteria bacterium]MBU1818868.1 YgjV family protein [Gammaproteobacteria bacterium]